MKNIFIIVSLCFTFHCSENVNAQSTFQEKDSVFQRCQKNIFNDDLSYAEAGKQDTNWEILQGSQIVDTIGGSKAVSFKQDGFTVLKPKPLTDSYLGYEFTIEFDIRRGNNLKWYFDSLFVIYLNTAGEKSQAMLPFSFNYAAYFYPDTRKFYPDPKNLSDNSSVKSLNSYFVSKPNKNSLWAHIAISCSERSVKVYMDYVRCFAIRNSEISPVNFFIGTTGSNKNTIYIRNFRVAIHAPSEEIKKFLATGEMTTYAINFDFNSAAIKPQSKIFIADIADLLKNNPNINIAINGYTDNIGTSVYNLTLSSQRAEAVKSELVSMGIEESRISTKGFGASKPIGDNNTEEGKAKNRRIEFVILQ